MQNQNSNGYNIMFKLNGNNFGNMCVNEKMMFIEVVENFNKYAQLKPENEATFSFNSKPIKPESSRTLKDLDIKENSIIEVTAKNIPINNAQNNQMNNNFPSMGTFQQGYQMSPQAGGMAQGMGGMYQGMGGMYPAMGGMYPAMGGMYQGMGGMAQGMGGMYPAMGGMAQGMGGMAQGMGGMAQGMGGMVWVEWLKEWVEWLKEWVEWLKEWVEWLKVWVVMLQILLEPPQILPEQLGRQIILEMILIGI